MQLEGVVNWIVYGAHGILITTQRWAGCIWHLRANYHSYSQPFGVSIPHTNNREERHEVDSDWTFSWHCIFQDLLILVIFRQVVVILVIEGKGMLWKCICYYRRKLVKRNI